MGCSKTLDGFTVGVVDRARMIEPLAKITSEIHRQHRAKSRMMVRIMGIREDWFRIE